jgi:hypothetical protein
LVGKLDGNSPLEKPERRCEYDIKDHFKEILYEDVGWIRMASALGSHEHTNEISGSVQIGKHFDHLRDYQRLEKIRSKSL